MRGRVYDPLIGRFLSVDPLVRDVTAAQSWNGYGYVEGRALSATDPTGFVLEVEMEEIVVKRRRCGRFDPECSEPVVPALLYLLPAPGSPDHVLGPLVVGEAGGSETAAQEGDRRGDLPPCSSIEGASVDLASQLAACRGNWSCENDVAAAARQSGLQLPPDPIQLLADFASISWLPISVLAPVGRVADDLMELASGVASAYDGGDDWIGSFGDVLLGAAYTRVLTPINREWAGRVGSVVGYLMQPVAQGAFGSVTAEVPACEP